MPGALRLLEKSAKQLVAPTLLVEMLDSNNIRNALSGYATHTFSPGLKLTEDFGSGSKRPPLTMVFSERPENNIGCPGFPPLNKSTKMNVH